MKIDTQLKKEIKSRVLADLRKEKEQTVIITTPYPLGEEGTELLYSSFPELKNFTIKNIIEKNIIGGMILQHKSKVIDISIRSKIEATVEKLISKS